MSRLDYCQYELVDDCYDWKNDNCDECNIFKAYCEGARRAKNSIVRCKDCRHLEVCNTEYTYAMCHKHHIRFEPFEDDTRNNYCSWGERAEQTEYKLPGYDEVMEKLDKLTLRGDKDE